jgi:hypothetical protein
MEDLRPWGRTGEVFSRGLCRFKKIPIIDFIIGGFSNPFEI